MGSCDAERTAAAAALVDWIDTEDMPNPVITGDLNAYDQEAPITTLEDGGYVDRREHFDGEEAYSYVFDGQLGYLDYIMAGEELMPFITGAASWHANSDGVPIFDYTTRFKQPAQQAIYEPGPYRASDHDPVIFGLSLTAGDDEEPTDPEEPVDPEDPDVTEPELLIDSERIAVQDFVANSNSGKDRGVLLRVDGLEVGQEVVFEITRQGRDGSAEHTVIASGAGIAELLVTRDNWISNGPPLSTYEVEATYGKGETLNGSFEVVPNLKGGGNNGTQGNGNGNGKGNNGNR